ncbi:AMP-binding enzyme [Streptomyces sp. NBC_01210]|uniref:AMP-binding enzyme n=1 Tax=Streptomyces sp. NBC_01210 TaxID=2903774 RepID=UPI003FA3D7F6
MATTSPPSRWNALWSPHSKVAEGAVVGAADQTTGQAIVAFVILRGSASEDQNLVNHLRIHVGQALGAIAKAKRITLVAELPKTSSGKIMRRLLRDVAENRQLGDVTRRRLTPTAAVGRDRTSTPNGRDRCT